MVKKTLVIYFLSIFLLVGCTNNSPSESSNNIEVSDDNKTDNKTSVKNSEKSIKSEKPGQNESGNENFKLTNLVDSQFIRLPYNDKGEYKIEDLELDNAGIIIFESLYLQKSDKVTIEFQLQDKDAYSHMTIGIIKNYSPDPNVNYEIENIYSESIEDKLKVTYTSPEDSSYSICIVGTMAAPVVVKNGKIIQH
ncbi:hypothetical protein H7T43_26765 [Peribacillus simplex]|uniref:hypothetical protein n=1 Tax=Peribacillus simplex TaxID=1478 RepID=UPI002989A50A|nr:hypothetical protein [Peribacillus simplex]MBX9958445.1 hypothetical protein [Peribacillus simplex]